MKTNFEKDLSGSARSGFAPISTPRCVPDAALANTTLRLPPKRILVPIDFSEASINALKYAEAIAEQFGASICLAHVVEGAPPLNELSYLPVAALKRDATLEARARLRDMVRAEVTWLVPVEMRVRIGSPFHEIVALANELDSDLIVIGTHGHTGLKHVLLGGTAERVVRHATCPVLVVRESENMKFHN